MASPTYSVLMDVEDENSFHRDRLLPVEQRVLRRPIDKLFTPASTVFKHTTSPLPNGTTTTEPSLAEIRTQWRDEMLLELSLLQSSMVRIQLLRRSNALECARYAASKDTILATASRIRSNTTALHERLADARQQLALRKEYDVLADKITSNRMLRTRDDQAVQLDKLAGEIAELEMEAAEYKRTWAERREQFGRIVGEGRQMLRLIKDEKEEAERKEGMDGGEEEGDAGSTARGAVSAVGTPAFGGSTPMPGDDGLDADRLVPPSFRKGSPSGRSEGKNDEGDVEMGEVNAETPAAHTNITSEMEEGEAEEDEQMGEA
ncbi:hypothetical protein BT63DRAFT_423204 [Microthyrium microscopicum]|uniref:Uncharacterized protein n=1 Tax=Microthyrium microscopicum TaxID=703497 RepID=A0A6A6UF85_9PEZI|nr:hypothetical protein BT63DRAFT_423204 [Microthyrium microscopicum]